MIHRRKTITQALKLASAKIDRLDAEILLCHALGVSREFILTSGKYECPALKFCKFLRLIKKRASGSPIAHIIGNKEFYGLKFIINKNVLVPRSETELMVDLAVDEIKLNMRGPADSVLLIDIGTGSGCLPIAIKKTMETKQIKNYPMETIAVDISKKALKIAKQNAKLHNIKIKFLRGNLLTPITRANRPLQDKYIIITANLPYLTLRQFKHEPSIRREPKQALIAGKQGLELYEQMLKQIKRAPMFQKIAAAVFFEINPSQSAPITALIKKYLQNAAVKIKKDLAGRDRIVIIKIK